MNHIKSINVYFTIDLSVDSGDLSDCDDIPVVIRLATVLVKFEAGPEN